VSKNDKHKEINGAIIQIVNNFFTDVRARISFHPVLEIPRPIIAAVFNLLKFSPS